MYPPTPPPPMCTCHELKYSISCFGTGGLNLHSQLLYAASSHILHANEAINTPAHPSDASPCRSFKHCSGKQYRFPNALELFTASPAHSIRVAQ